MGKFGELGCAVLSAYTLYNEDEYKKYILPEA